MHRWFKNTQNCSTSKFLPFKESQRKCVSRRMEQNKIVTESQCERMQETKGKQNEHNKIKRKIYIVYDPSEQTTSAHSAWPSSRKVFLQSIPLFINHSNLKWACFRLSLDGWLMLGCMNSAAWLVACCCDCDCERNLQKVINYHSKLGFGEIK